MGTVFYDKDSRQGFFLVNVVGDGNCGPRSAYTHRYSREQPLRHLLLCLCCADRALLLGTGAHRYDVPFRCVDTGALLRSAEENDLVDPAELEAVMKFKEESDTHMSYSMVHTAAYI